MNNNEDTKDELLLEYNFDYSKAKPNRFATQQSPVTVTLDADVAKIFTDSKAVNNTLRAILSALPNQQQLHEIK
jgi:hypothetical protein